MKIHHTVTGRTIHSEATFVDIRRHTVNYAIQAERAHLMQLDIMLLQQLLDSGIKVGPSLDGEVVIICPEEKLLEAVGHLKAELVSFDFETLERRARPQHVNLSFHELYGGIPFQVLRIPTPEPTMDFKSDKKKWWERRSEDRQCGNSPSAKTRERNRKRRLK